MNKTGSLSGMKMPGIRPLASTPQQYLGGRLRAISLDHLDGGKGKVDLYWPGAHLPTFRHDRPEQKLDLLARPNAENVRALFDLAHEQGIGMPQITISGTPEFQRLAAAEAARRGLPVDMSELDESAREIYHVTLDQQHGEALGSIASDAYESADREEERREIELERQRAESAKNDDADREQHPRGQQQMRG